MNSKPTTKASYPLLPVLIAVALLVKVALLLSLCDVFFYGEELEKATAAKGMLDAVPIAHHKLAYHYYEGGGFVISHAKALAFWLVGPSYFANKLVSLVSITLVLWAALVMIRRHFSSCAAFWFGVLFIFAPESFQKLPLLSLGIHFEACLFLIWMFDLTLSIAFKHEKRWRAFAALGVVAGLGTYFSYQVLPAAGYCAIVLAFRRPKLIFAPRGLLGLACFCIGLAPLIWMYTLVGDAIFDVHGTALVGGTDYAENSLKLREFLLSVFSGQSALSLLQPVAYVAATLFAIYHLWTDREQERLVDRGPALFIVIFIGYWLLIYATSSFVMGHAHYYYHFNRFVPLWIVLAILISIWITRLRTSDDLMTQRMGLFLGSMLVLFGGFSTWRVLSEGRPTHIPENWEILRSTKGYTYQAYFAKLKHHLGGTLEEKLDLVKQFDEDPRLLYPDIAQEFLTVEELRPEGDLSFEALARRLEAWDSEATPNLMRGLGRWIHYKTRGDVRGAMQAILGFEERFREPLWEAVGRFGKGYLHPLHAEHQIRAEVDLGLGQPGESHFLLGTGERIYHLFRIRPDKAQEFIESMPPEARPALHRGYDQARDLRLLE